MPYSIILENGFQVLIDEKTGELLELSEPQLQPGVEVLQDDKFPWKERKRRTLRLADLYGLAGFPKLQDRAKACSTWLEYLAMYDGRRQLFHFNPCKLRLCPLCVTRKARVAAMNLSKIMDYVANKYGNVSFLFLTLTIKNVDGCNLGQAITTLTEGWAKLRRHRPVARAVKGWYRALEITRNDVDGTYHPHIHAILAVEDDYFKPSKGLYITQPEWVDRWKKALGVSYKPIVGIQATRPKPGQPASKSKQVAAVSEAAKYATKDSDFLSDKLTQLEAAQVVKDYTLALAGRRLTAVGGWFSEAAKELALQDSEDSDLVHDGEDGELREDMAELLETYNWRFGAGEYLLTRRVANPSYQAVP